jgi:hypothetical protein
MCYQILRIFAYCKITYFRWDFILRFCHFVSLQQFKIQLFWKGCNRKP